MSIKAVSRHLNIACNEPLPYCVCNDDEVVVARFHSRIDAEIFLASNGLPITWEAAPKQGAHEKTETQ